MIYWSMPWRQLLWEMGIVEQKGDNQLVNLHPRYWLAVKLPELEIMLGVGVHVAVELDAGVEPHRVEQVGLGPAGRRVWEQQGLGKD